MTKKEEREIRAFADSDPLTAYAVAILLDETTEEEAMKRAHKATNAILPGEVNWPKEWK